MAGCGLAADDCIFFGIRSGMCVENELLRSGIGGHSPLEESVITSMYVGIRSIRIFADFDLASEHAFALALRFLPPLPLLTMTMTMTTTE
jgi:hypothetical protein